MSGDSIHTDERFGDEPIGATTAEAAQNLLGITSNIASLVSSIQALAREQEHEVANCGHIVNLADITSEQLDRLQDGIDHLRWPDKGTAEESRPG